MRQRPMAKLGAGVLSAALLLAASGTWAGSPTGPPEPPSQGGRVKSGSGFFVSQPGYLLTSQHVVAGCAGVTVWPTGGGALKARTIASDQQLDIALLAVEGRRDGGTVPRYAARPAAGAPVVVIGFGVVSAHPREAVFTHGTLAGLGTLADGDNVLYVRADLHPGDSGAPVIDRSGAVLGMVIGRLADKTGIGVAIAGDEIRRFLAWNGVEAAVQSSGSPSDPPAATVALVQCGAAPSTQ